MAVGADLDLQRGIVTKLMADTELLALVSSPLRLFQDVPPPATLQFPYVTLGTSQRLPDLAECIDGAEIFAELHVFARSPGYELVKRIGGTIVESLHNASLTLQEHRCVLIELSDERYFVDQDNTTKHGVITFRALLEPTD